MINIWYQCNFIPSFQRRFNISKSKYSRNAEVLEFVFSNKNKHLRRVPWEFSENEVHSAASAKQNKQMGWAQARN